MAASSSSGPPPAAASGPAWVEQTYRRAVHQLEQLPREEDEDFTKPEGDHWDAARREVQELVKQGLPDHDIAAAALNIYRHIASVPVKFDPTSRTRVVDGRPCQAMHVVVFMGLAHVTRSIIRYENEGGSQRNLASPQSQDFLSLSPGGGAEVTHRAGLIF